VELCQGKKNEVKWALKRSKTNVIMLMNYLGASSRGIKNANAQGESGTDPRVGVLTKKRIK